jgi:DNA-binding transcriptional LysR family regulator
VLRDIHNVRRVEADFRGEDSGTLTIATTHVHARYILLPVVKQFRRSFPNVRLVLDQGNPNEVVGLVNEGRADIGLCSAPTKPVGRAVELPCFRVPRAVVVPAEHPLLRAERRVSIADLAAYPFIMLDPSFSGGVSVQAAFRENGIEPNVVLTATDADVVKAYVEAGCGIATLPEIAFDPRRDEALRLIDARHLFVPSLSSLWIEKGRYLRRFAFDFIQMVSPVWTPTLVDRQLTSAEPLDVGMAIEVGSTSLPYGS